MLDAPRLGAGLLLKMAMRFVNCRDSNAVALGHGAGGLADA